MRIQTPGCKFPKSNRLRKRADFVKLFNADNKFTVKGFLIVWQINDLMQPRLGVTVSKKVGCAVIRNRIKRYTREFFRHNCSLLPLVDLNVIARRDSFMMDFCAVARELGKAFRHIVTATPDKQNSCVNEVIFCCNKAEKSC